MPATHLRGVAPSILSADFGRLGEQVKTVLDAGATVIHVDVMDGQFVPPITMGPLIIDAIAGLVHDAGAKIDTHLMIDRPERLVADFAEAGSDSITVHFEATPNVHYALTAVREAGCGAGLAISPATSPEVVVEVADILDLVLCMTVNPGWGGQAFLTRSPQRIARLREIVGPDITVEVDGGIGVTTAAVCAEAGADLFVAGSAVFGAGDPSAAVREIAAAAGQPA